MTLLQIFHIFISYIVGWPGEPNLRPGATMTPRAVTNHEQSQQEQKPGYTDLSLQCLQRWGLPHNTACPGQEQFHLSMPSMDNCAACMRNADRSCVAPASLTHSSCVCMYMFRQLCVTHSILWLDVVLFSVTLGMCMQMLTFCTHLLICSPHNALHSPSNN